MEEDTSGLSRIKKLKECLMEQQDKQNPVIGGSQSTPSGVSSGKGLNIVMIYADSPTEWRQT